MCIRQLFFGRFLCLVSLVTFLLSPKISPAEAFGGYRRWVLCHFFFFAKANDFLKVWTAIFSVNTNNLKKNAGQLQPLLMRRSAGQTSLNTGQKCIPRYRSFVYIVDSSSRSSWYFRELLKRYCDNLWDSINYYFYYIKPVIFSNFVIRRAFMLRLLIKV